MARIAGPCGRILLEYNRNRDVDSLFVRDEIRIGSESVSATGQRFDFVSATMIFAALDIALPGGFQINNAAIAVTLFCAGWSTRGPPSSATASRPPCEPACARRAGPAGSR